MTRAERIIRIAEELVAYAEEYQSMPFAHIAFLREALALPPDPVPRRLTEEDVAHCIGDDDATVRQITAGLNARIFGEQK